MSKRDMNKGAGPYSQNTVKLTRPSNVDQRGFPKDRAREIANAAERVSGTGLSRVVSKGGAPRRYGP